jgi:hypothetical protein
MIKQDVLEKLNSGEFTIEQVEKFYEEILNSPNADQLYSLLCLTKVESTAFLHGVPFEVLAKWRKTGMIDVCAKCGGKIALDKYGWRIKEHDDVENLFTIYHYQCP